jgi:hypothetical protein
LVPATWVLSGLPKLVRPDLGARLRVALSRRGGRSPRTLAAPPVNGKRIGPSAVTAESQLGASRSLVPGVEVLQQPAPALGRRRRLELRPREAPPPQEDRVPRAPVRHGRPQCRRVGRLPGGPLEPHGEGHPVLLSGTGRWTERIGGSQPRMLLRRCFSALLTPSASSVQETERPRFRGLSMVGGTGLEPVTSGLSSRRSPS